MSPDLQSEIADQVISEALPSPSVSAELWYLKNHNEKVFYFEPLLSLLSFYRKIINSTPVWFVFREKPPTILIYLPHFKQKHELFFEALTSFLGALKLFSGADEE